MILRTVVAPLLGATCVVLAQDDRCVVVDPGGGVADDLLALVTEAGLTPLAILLTHGHVDHTWSAAQLSAAWAVPVHVHEADVYRLADPLGTLGPLGAQLAAMSGLPSPQTPRRLEPFTTAPDGTGVLRCGEGRAAIEIDLLHVPGHTQGSTTYLLDADGPTALTGDVLFAGTIGRTDLPGGDARLMASSLSRLAALPSSTVVVPGHGPTSTVGAELATNPYLRAAR